MKISSGVTVQAISSGRAAARRPGPIGRRARAITDAEPDDAAGDGQRHRAAQAEQARNSDRCGRRRSMRLAPAGRSRRTRFASGVAFMAALRARACVDAARPRARAAAAPATGRRCAARASRRGGEAAERRIEMGAEQDELVDQPADRAAGCGVERVAQSDRIVAHAEKIARDAAVGGDDDEAGRVREGGAARVASSGGLRARGRTLSLAAKTKPACRATAAIELASPTSASRTIDGRASLGPIPFERRTRLPGRSSGHGGPPGRLREHLQIDAPPRLRIRGRLGRVDADREHAVVAWRHAALASASQRAFHHRLAQARAVVVAEHEHDGHGRRASRCSGNSRRARPPGRSHR